MKNSKDSYTISNKLRGYSNYILALVVLFSLVSLIGNFIRIRRGSERLSETRSQIEILKEEQSKLLDQIAFAESTTYKEAQMRNSLGLAKEGEIVLVLPDDDVLRRLAPRIPEEPKEIPKENWEKWMELFI